jgi:hypothetical protein
LALLFPPPVVRFLRLPFSLISSMFHISLFFLLLRSDLFFLLPRHLANSD